MHVIDDYDVRIRDYYRMSLYLAHNIPKMKIPFKAIEKDTKDIMDPLYNRDNIYDSLIMNGKIVRDEWKYEMMGLKSGNNGKEISRR